MNKAMCEQWISLYIWWLFGVKAAVFLFFWIGLKFSDPWKQQQVEHNSKWEAVPVEHIISVGMK